MKSWVSLLIASIGLLTAIIACVGKFLGIFDGGAKPVIEYVLDEAKREAQPPPIFVPNLSPQQTTTSPPQPLQFVIFDSLSDGQSSETVEVYFSQQYFGLLSLDSQRTKVGLKGSAPRPGLYQYSLKSSTTLNIQGESLILPCAGTGSVALVDGARYTVESNNDLGACRIWLAPI